MQGEELNNYIIDVVYAVEGGCQMKCYGVTASSGEAAYERFLNEETTDFPLVYEGEIVSAIIIGVGLRG